MTRDISKSTALVRCSQSVLGQYVARTYKKLSKERKIVKPINHVLTDACGERSLARMVQSDSLLKK